MKKKYLLIYVLFLCSTGLLYSIDLVNQMATFIGKAPPEQARHIRNSSYYDYILTISDKYDSSETIMFWVDTNNKIIQVCYNITCKDSYSFSSRDVEHFISEIRYESKKNLENFDGVPYGSYKYGEYFYNNYLLSFRVSYNIPYSTVKSVEWLISINPNESNSNTPQQVNENGFIGTINNNEITITNYTGSRKDIVIPASINGIKVIYIGKKAFANKRITSVTIPNGIKVIGDDAFYMNELTSVVIPNSVVNIESGAFRENRLTNVRIPSSVVTMGTAAFMDNNLTEVNIPPITSLEPNVFAGNRLTTVTIPDTVTIIKYSAFSSNYITSVYIPNSVRTIQGAFTRSAYNDEQDKNNITKISIGADVEIAENSYRDARYGPFGHSFKIFYDQNQKKAGVYTLKNNVWLYSEE